MTVVIDTCQVVLSRGTNLTEDILLNLSVVRSKLWLIDNCLVSLICFLDDSMRWLKPLHYFLQIYVLVPDIDTLTSDIFCNYCR